MINLGLSIKAAQGDYLIDESGQEYFDVCMGYGSVSLGHNYTPVINGQIDQLNAYASPGFLDSSIFTRAKQEVEQYIDGYSVHGFYPSGANAVEIAIKMAVTSKDRPKIISFKNSMHGKTLFASQLGTTSCQQDESQIINIPFVDEKTESDILKACESHMCQGKIAAVIVEPVQMSGGGYRASRSFCHSLGELASRYDVIQIYDEILTGFHRTGIPFLFYALDVKPDIVLSGKAMGGGFPVSAILQKNSFTAPKNLRAGGTYFNHPLACASVIATLDAYRQLDVAVHINKIESCVMQNLPARNLSGQGALWNINLVSQKNTLALVEELFNKNIVVSFYDQYIRLLPSFRADISALSRVCQIVRQYL